MMPFGFSVFAESCVAFFSFLSLFFFFLLSRVSGRRQNLLFIKQMSLFQYCSRTVHENHSHFIQKKKIKMGPTVLFTHLKIILLQYFQFQQKYAQSKRTLCLSLIFLEGSLPQHASLLKLYGCSSLLIPISTTLTNFNLHHIISLGPFI